MDHRIGAGILFRKAERFHKTGEQNDARIRIQFANALNQFPPVHARHSEIRDYYIELPGFEEAEAIFRVERDLYSIPEFFKKRTPYQEPVSIVIH